MSAPFQKNMTVGLTEAKGWKILKIASVWSNLGQLLQLIPGKPLEWPLPKNPRKLFGHGHRHILTIAVSY